jgi:hypothetical protein
MKRIILVAALLLAVASVVHSGESAPQKKPSPPAMDRLRSLAGTWVTGPMEKFGNQPQTITFKVTANDSAVVETMFPGTDHEMVNVYHADGDKAVMVTHYCAMGIQPRMRLTSPEDARTMKFSFVDCTNLPSRDEGHMDSIDLTLDGEKLTEDWSFYKDGKVADHTILELTKQDNK